MSKKFKVPVKNPDQNNNNDQKQSKNNNKMVIFFFLLNINATLIKDQENPENDSLKHLDKHMIEMIESEILD